MRKESTINQKYEVFEKFMIGGLAIFAAFALVEISSFDNLVGPSIFALCCLSVSLPFLIFQIACTTLGVKHIHQPLLQTVTIVVALVGVVGLLISISAIVGILFLVSCIIAYYVFTVFSKESQ
jgi:hypothetical protein